MWFWRGAKPVQLSNVEGLVWLASYPKSGNTWMRSLLSGYFNETAEEADINELYGGPIASSRTLFGQAVGVEAANLLPDEIDNLRPGAYRWLLRNQPPSPFIKVHDQWRRSPSGEAMFPRDVTAGVIYVVRNPLDVAVSAAHHFGVTMAESVAHLCDHGRALGASARTTAGQVRQMVGSWSDHVSSWITQRECRVHVLRFEDLLRDPHAMLRSVVEFVREDVDEQRIDRAVRCSSFDTMQRLEREKGFRERPGQASAAFFRRGIAGSWRDELPKDLAMRLMQEHAPMMRQLAYLDDIGLSTY